MTVGKSRATKAAQIIRVITLNWRMGSRKNHHCSGSAIAIALRQSQPETPRVDETIAKDSHARRHPIQSGISPVFSPEYTCVFIPTSYDIDNPGLQARTRM